MRKCELKHTVEVEIGSLWCHKGRWNVPRVDRQHPRPFNIPSKHVEGTTRHILGMFRTLKCYITACWWWGRGPFLWERSRAERQKAADHRATNIHQHLPPFRTENVEFSSSHSKPKEASESRPHFRAFGRPQFGCGSRPLTHIVFLVFLPLCLLGTITPCSESQKSKIIPMKGGGGERGVEKKMPGCFVRRVERDSSWDSEEWAAGCAGLRSPQSRHLTCGTAL